MHRAKLMLTSLLVPARFICQRVLLLLGLSLIYHKWLAITIQ